MNDIRTPDRSPLERRIAAWLADEGAVGAPAPDGDIDRILSATSRLRPDPRWLALLKESPMRTTTGTGARIGVGSPARALVLALLAVGLLAAIGLAVVASGVLRQPGPPAPLSSLAWRHEVPANQFFALAPIARDPQGRLWVADAASGRFAIYQADGTFVEFWKPTNGPTFDLHKPNGDGYGGIAFGPDGSRFVLDVGNHRVLAYDPDGTLRTFWGEGTGPEGLVEPVGIAVDGEAMVWVLDDVRGVAEAYNANGALLSTVNVFTTTPAGENTANGLAVDRAGNLYVSMVKTRSVEKFSPAGKHLLTFGRSGFGRFSQSQGSQPQLLAVDPAGYLYVTQGQLQGDEPGVLIFDPAGVYVGGFGSLGAAPGQLDFATGIAVDGQGNLVVIDSGHWNGTAFDAPSIEGYRINLKATK